MLYSDSSCNIDQILTGIVYIDNDKKEMQERNAMQEYFY